MANEKKRGRKPRFVKTVYVKEPSNEEMKRAIDAVNTLGETNQSVRSRNLDVNFQIGIDIDSK